jgi:hypothetical protein
MTQLINFPKILDERGNLSFVEEDNQIPFTLQRAYWIYDVPGGESGGRHAFKKSEEIIIALSGSFDILIHDGNKENKFTLNRSYYGLYIPKLTWRELENFSTNSLALILSSTFYDENDYIRDFNEYLSILKRNL